MATTTHNLKIKAVLDTSEIRSQLNGIRESSAVGSGVNSSLDLNNAISRLIQALDKLPSNISREQKQSGVTSNFNARAFAAFAVGYGINKIGNSFSELLEAKGYSKTDVVKSALTNIGTGAVAGAAFGPAGAALGAAFGVATAAIDSWADSVKKSQDELQKWNDIIKEAQKTQQKESSYLTERNSREFLSQAIKRGDIDSLMQARQNAYQKNLSARELMGKDLPAMLEEKKALEQRIKDIDDRRQRTTYTQSTYGVQAQTVGDLTDKEADAQIEQVKEQMAQLEENIKRRNSALEVAQATDKEIADIDAAIAQIEADKKQVAEQALKAQEDELKEIQKAQEEAKKRVEAMTSLNQAISDQIESYDRSEETENTKKLIESGDYREIVSENKNKITESGDYKAIAVEKNRQDQIADQQKEAYRGFLESAENASTPEGKEFFLQQAEQAKASWQQAQTQSDMLGSKQDSLTSLITSMIKSSKNDSDGQLDASINDFSSDYKAGLGIGEVGYDVSQDKTDKIIDITTVIKDVLEEIKNEQKTQTEVTRQLKSQGLL